MPRAVLLALGLATFLVPARLPADGKGIPPAPASPTAVAAVPYSPDLIREVLADAKANGDARRGAAVFSQSACLGCHQVADRGGQVGPALTTVGTCLSPEEIVEAVLWPNRTVKPEFKAVAVSLANGKEHTGIHRGETANELTLVDAAGKTLRIPKKDIDDRRDVGSLMPDGLTAALSAGQRRDLVRYLLELGRTRGLEALAHEPAKFVASREPLHPDEWPNWTHPVNRDRVYDWYAKQAAHFLPVRPTPLLLPEWPGMDGGKYGHWGNQNDAVWADNRWSQTDVGSLQCGVFRSGSLTVPRAVCVRLGDRGELAACFNPDTLRFEAVWSGGFVAFSEFRSGFLDGLRPAGPLLPLPPEAAPPGGKAASFVYHGFYRHGRRVLFSYRLGGTEMLDAPWVEGGRFLRVVAPADRHPLAPLTRGGPAQWPQVLTTAGARGRGRPYAVDTIPLPRDNPWKALLYIGGHDLFPDGSAAICTMQGDVWRADGLDDSLHEVRWRRIAAGLHHALGLVVADSTVYVLGRDQVTRLSDLNGDGETDFYECFSKAYESSPAGHDFICGLERDAAGNFYTASGNQGLLRLSPDGKRADVIATGFRNPDGLGLAPDGRLTVPCSEGEWTPASMICEVRPRPGRTPHFGYRGPVKSVPPDLPLVYLPRGLDNSSGGQAYVAGDRWGPLQGQMVHTSFGTGTHFLLLRDEVDGQPQGAVVPLSGDFRSGVHRARFSPADGQLYLAGMAGWGTYTPDDGCFQRVRYTGDPVQLPRRFHVHQNGILLEWTRPLDRTLAENAGRHFAQCWNYRYGPGYGSPEYSPSHYGRPGHDPLAVAGAHVLPDGRALFLEIPDLQPINVLHLHLGIAPDRATDVFVTVHRLDAPFRGFPGSRDTPKVVAAHPLLRDLAAVAQKAPNPWQKPLPGAREVVLEAGKNLTYATPLIRARAGEPLRLTFRNPDVVPHNWVLVKPGMLRQVGELANQLIADPDAVLRHYVPRSPAVLAYTDVVQPGEALAISFHAPKEKGRYPFLCTFPGHWMVMNGELVVEE